MTGRIYQWPPGPHGMSDLWWWWCLTWWRHYIIINCALLARASSVFFILCLSKELTLPQFISHADFIMCLLMDLDHWLRSRGGRTHLWVYVRGFPSSVAMRLFFLLTLFYYKLIISEEWTLNSRRRGWGPDTWLSGEVSDDVICGVTRRWWLLKNNDSWDSVSARVKQLLIFIIIIITTVDLFKAYKSSFQLPPTRGFT